MISVGIRSHWTWSWHVQIEEEKHLMSEWNIKDNFGPLKIHVEGVSAWRCLWPSLRPLVQNFKRKNLCSSKDSIFTIYLWYKTFNVFDLLFMICKTRCDGRQMVDGVPTVPEQLSYTTEVPMIMILLWFFMVGSSVLW